MKTILFVDDVANVLEGLKRMFFPMRKEWKMLFAEGGEEALALLAQHPVDVVVTDMRMPGMSGRYVSAMFAITKIARTWCRRSSSSVISVWTA